MPEQATEIGYLPLKAGLDLESGEAKAAWDKALSTIAKQPGFKTLFWGRQIENPDVAQLVIDWESIDAHKAFIALPEYHDFFKNLDEHILSGAPTLFHIHLPTPDPAAANPLLAPVTECVSAYFPASFSSPTYSAQFAQFQATALQIPNVEASGLEGGWSVEAHQHEAFGEGVDGKLFAAFIGWPSVEAHQAFRKTEDFGKVIGLLREGTVGIKVWHVAFKQFK